MRKRLGFSNHTYNNPIKMSEYYHCFYGHQCLNKYRTSSECTEVFSVMWIMTETERQHHFESSVFDRIDHCLSDLNNFNNCSSGWRIVAISTKHWMYLKLYRKKKQIFHIYAFSGLIELIHVFIGWIVHHYCIRQCFLL